MAVRFLPASGAAPSGPAPERSDLAEVIDLRSRLIRRTDPVVDQSPGVEAPAEDRVKDPIAEVTRLRAAVKEIESEAPAGSEPHEADVIADPSDARSAAEDGVRLLARKARSHGELRRELIQLGHEANEVERVLLEFEGSLYLDDLGLARLITEGLRERKRASRSQIRMKLRERLLPDGVIEEVLGELDDDEEFALLRAAAEERARRLSGLDRQTAERRLLGFLARRGWSGERAVRAAREALDGSGHGRGSVRFR